MANNAITVRDNAAPSLTFYPESTDLGSSVYRPLFGSSDGAQATIGSKADAAYTGPATASVVSILKGLYAAITAAIPAGTNIIGSISERSVTTTAAPTVTASAAYTTGQVVGGLLTFANAVDGTSGIINSIRLSCKSVVTGNMKLYLFHTNPSSSTFTDKTAPSINVADVPSLSDVFYLTTADSGLGTHTLYSYDNVGKRFVLPSGTSLYGVLVTSGTPTFGSTSDITVSLNIKKD